jgi:hypothetical protein
MGFVHTRDDGTYRLHGVMAGVPLLVRTEHPWISSMTSEPLTVVPDGIRKGVDFEVDPAGGVRIVLRGDALGAARGGWALSLLGNGKNHSADFSGAVGEVTGVAPGTWTLDVFSMGHFYMERGERPPDRFKQRRQVEIVAGCMTQVEISER